MTQKNIYTISTEEAEKWLQRWVDVEAKMARQNGKTVPRIKVTLYTVPLSRKFLPFKVILPEEAISSEDNKLLHHMFSAIGVFMYKEVNVDELHKEATISELDLTTKTMKYIDEWAELKVDVTDGVKTVQCLLDPLKIFTAMAKEKPGAPQYNYLLNITGAKYNQEGSSASYTFEVISINRKNAWTIGKTNPILKGEDVDGHTKYLQEIDLPIKINSIIEDGELKLSDVSEMHIADVNGVSTLIITPEIIG